MATGEQPESPSRHTNQNNSVTPAEPGNSPDLRGGSSDFADNLGELMALQTRELPTPAARVAEFHEKYPERARLPLIESQGTTIRRDYCHERYEEWSGEGSIRVDHDGDLQVDELVGDRLVERWAYTWGEAVEELLESHETKRHTTLYLEKGIPTDDEHEKFGIPAETRWSADYQKRYFAQMKGWLREQTGGVRPSGGECEGAFSDPRIVLMTFSASSVPDDERVSPGEHTDVRRSSWSDCYDTLRNQMRRLGVEWQYDRRSEPHTGKRGGGLNRCYGHDHVVLLVDGDVQLSDFRPVVEKHVEECDWAGAEAHDLDVSDWEANRHDVETVEIREPEELEDIAAYVADYCSIEPTDLLDRSAEFIGWAASVTATNTKTISRSDGAKWAATADRCKQRFESEASDQSVDHGESVIRSDRRGAEVECAKCGSPHGIDQDQTLSAARMDGASTGVAADGGVEDRAEKLAERWPSAYAGAAYGETPTRAEWRSRIQDFLKRHPDASKSRILGSLGLPPRAGEVIDEIDAGLDPNEVVSFVRSPEWKLSSIEIYDEEYPASPGNGVEMVELQEDNEWKPPHKGGTYCMSCGADGTKGVQSAAEIRAVHGEYISGAYRCESCGKEFAEMGGPERPPDVELMW